jgi:pilus assembly protein CpaC
MKKIQWGGFVGMVVLAVIGMWSIPFAHADSIQVSVGEAIMIPGENVTKLAIADPTVADVVPLSDKELSVIGKKAGVTTLTVVKSDGSATEQHRIEVSNDAAATTIRQMIGSSEIKVRSIGDALVLDGKVNDEIEAQRAAQIAGAYKAQVVNLLEIRRPRQIKVRTRVAEVSTDAIKNLGIQYFGANGQVRYGFGRLSLSEPGANPSDFSGHMFLDPNQVGNQTITAGSIPVGVSATLDLLVQKNHARLLSEPTLVTYSGKEASFLVGQEVPIVQQLPQSFTVEFKEVGVRMKIKPTADSENRISTVIHAEVSQIVGSGANGIPIIGAKTADTTLQVDDGQTIVIGGLLENNVSRDLLRKLPWLADIPVIGLLFRDKQFEQAQTEVLFLMTPEVIKNVDADTADSAKTRMMQGWIGHSDKGLLKSDDQQDDWGVHNPDSLGFGAFHSKSKTSSVKPAPAMKPAPAKPAAAAKSSPTPVSKPAKTERPVVVSPPVASPAAEKPVMKQPAPAAPTEDPTTNFSPARPAGE